MPISRAPCVAGKARGPYIFGPPPQGCNLSRCRSTKRDAHLRAGDERDDRHQRDDGRADERIELADPEQHALNAVTGGPDQRQGDENAQRDAESGHDRTLARPRHLKMLTD
jgi:hypothetical protein